MSGPSLIAPMLVAVMGEPENRLASLREENVELRGQFNRRHRLYVLPQGGDTHAAVQ